MKLKHRTPKGTGRKSRLADGFFFTYNGQSVTSGRKSESNKILVARAPTSHKTRVGRSAIDAIFGIKKGSKD